MSPGLRRRRDADPAGAALRELRARRKRNRMGSVEWFETLYRVYLVALLGGGAVLWLSDLIGDGPVSASAADDISAHAPAVLGLAAVVAVTAGLRSGSQGGPLALESPDVVYVMTAPISRARALARPTFQRVRSAMFAAGAVGAVLGQLAAHRLPGSGAAWALGGMLFGVTLAALWAGCALVAHAVRLPLALAGAVGAALTGWQAAAIAGPIPGPGDQVGDLALWGWRQHPTDAFALVAAAAVVATGAALVGRTSLEALARRSGLVAQLRFAVTMQDLRTVVLLRRQLNHERTRARPWVRLPASPPSRGRTAGIVRRGLHGFLRFPAGRIVRMVALVAGASACQVAAYRGTTPAILGTTVLLFVLGLDLLEPLSQEVDQPDHTDGYPIERGELMAFHLIAPALFLAPLAVVAAVVAGVVQGSTGALAVALVLAVPTMMCGVMGSVVNIVRDAPDPVAAGTQGAFVPPEMAGLSTVVRTIVPLVVSALGAATVIGVRAAVRAEGTGAALPTAVRMAVGGILVVVAGVLWVRRRDRVRRWFRRLMDGARAEARTRGAL